MACPECMAITERRENDEISDETVSSSEFPAFVSRRKFRHTFGRNCR